jgi:hypothetical protein
MDCSNLEENLSFGICEENPSLQEMLEAANKHRKKNFVVQIPTFAELKPESDFEPNEMEFPNLHELNYECPPPFLSSPLNIEENHEFQYDLEGQTIKEMLDTTFQSTSHEFGFGEGQSKGSLAYGSEGILPQILPPQDLQQVNIIQQLDLEESHLFAESIEEQGLKEMQESPIGSEGQDFLDEIMTCEGDVNEEMGPTIEQLHGLYNVCSEDPKIEKRKNSNIQNNTSHPREPEREVCSTWKKLVHGSMEGKRQIYSSN